MSRLTGREMSLGILRLGIQLVMIGLFTYMTVTGRYPGR